MKKTYTDAELIAILEVARDKYLWEGKGRSDGKTYYVCYAINGAMGGELYHARRVPVKLHNLVKRHIGRNYTMRGFLYEQLGDAAGNNLSQKDIQTYRQMMINNMIKMLQKGEKNG